MFRRAVKKALPGAYDALRSAYYAALWWADRNLKDHGAQKNMEFRLQKLLRGLDRYPVDPAKPRFLFGPIEGYPLHAAYCGLLALRLRREGHHVEFLTCRRNLPFCTTGQFERKELPCDWCVKMKDATYAQAFPTTDLGDPGAECRADMERVARMSMEECRAFTWRGFPVGHLCRVAVCWFSRRANIDPRYLPDYRAAICAAMIVIDRFPHHLDRARPDRVVLLNGHLFTAAVPLEMCRQRNILCYTYETGQFPDTVIVCRERPAAAHKVDETYLAVKDVPLAAAERKWIVDHLHERRHGAVLRHLRESQKAGEASTPAVSDPRPYAIAFPNMSWDTAILGEDTVFEGGHDWLVALVSHFRDHPEWRLIVRGHPAESFYRHIQSQDRIDKLLPSLVQPWPENVQIIPSETRADSYALMDGARCVLVYTSTTSMEAVHWGTPALAAGKGRVYKKGFVQDPDTRDAYFAVLADLMNHPRRTTDAEKDNLYRFAYHYFFERMVPFEPVEVERSTMTPRLRIRFARQLHAGKWRGFDTICRRLVAGDHVAVGPRTELIAKFRAPPAGA